MALYYQVHKTHSYGAAVGHPDPLFTYNTIQAATGYGPNQKLTGSISCSISNANTNGTFTGEAHMQIEQNFGGDPWYSIGYIRVPGKVIPHQTFSKFVTDITSATKNRMATQRQQGMRGRVVSGYFHLNAGSVFKQSCNTELEYTAYNAPTTVTVNPTSVAPEGEATLSWLGVTGGTGLSISEYEVYRSSTSSSTGFTLQGSTSSSSMKVYGNATANASYWYKVKVIASVSGYDSGLSSATAQLQSPVGTPTAPTVVKFDSSDPVPPSTMHTLKWSGASGATNNAISKYWIYRSTSSASPGDYWGETTQTSYSVGSPATNGSYYFRVRTMGAAGIDSDMSGAYAELETAFSVPSTPSNLALSVNNIPPSGKSTLSWTASSDGTNNAVTGYEISRAESVGGTYSVQAANHQSTSQEVTGQGTSGKSYYYRVKALAPYGNSALSSTISLTTTVGTISPPSNVQIGGGTLITVPPSEAVNLTWTKSADATNNAVTGYAIYRSVSGGAFSILTTTNASASSYEITSPATEIQTRYYIVALGERSNSGNSQTVTMTVSMTTAETATFTLSPTTVEAGNVLTINITSNAEKQQKAYITFFTKSAETITIAPNVSVAQYTIPQNWCVEIPNSTTGAGKVKVETYDGGVFKGAREQSFSISVPQEVVPTIEVGAFTATRNDNSVVPSAWEKYVVTKSKVDLTIPQAVGAQGSSIIEYKISGGGVNSISATPFSVTSPVLSSLSTTFTATVKDSRQRVSNYNIPISAEPYVAPSLSVESFRSNATGVEMSDGTYGKVNATTKFSTVSGKNTVSISVKYREKSSAAEWTDIGSDTSGTGDFAGFTYSEVFGGALAHDKYYEVLYTVTDAVATTVSYVDDISSSAYFFHIRQNGRGLGIGGASMADNTLNVHWDLVGINVSGEVLKEDGVSLPDKYFHYEDTKTATVDSVGWYTVAIASTARAYGKFVIYDVASSNHNLIDLTSISTYGHNTNTVTAGISYRAAGNVTKIRTLYLTADRTYGGAMQQVYVASAGYDQSVLAEKTRAVAGWDKWELVLPEKNDSPDGWSVDANSTVDNATGNTKGGMKGNFYGKFYGDGSGQTGQDLPDNYVPDTRTINDKTLDDDITLDASDVGAVPTARTVNSKALSDDISLDASDVSAVPTSRTINTKALTGDISLTAADVGAAATSHGTHVTYSTGNPAAPGTASPGTSANVSRGDHVHPAQTSVSGSAGTAGKWASPITMSIGGAQKSVDGSQNISWSLGDIGIVVGGASASSSTSTGANISYGVTFKYVPKVQASWSKEGNNVSGAFGPIKIYNRSTTKFSAVAGGDQPSSAQSINWIAIGEIDS